MATTFLTLVHLVCCILLVICSFLSIGPLAAVIRNFKGHCLIGANITISTKNGESYHVLASDAPGGRANCVLPELMGAMALMFSIVYLIWNSCLVFMNKESSWRDSFIGTVLSGALTLISLISGALITSGINKLCKDLGRGTYRCETTNYEDSNWLAWRENDGNILLPSQLDSESFYTMFKISQAGCWLSFVTFIVVLLIYLIKLKQNSLDGGFMQNLSQERDRLVDQANQRRYDQI